MALIEKETPPTTHLRACHTTASGDDIPVLRATRCHLCGEGTFVFSGHQDLSFSCLLPVVVSLCLQLCPLCSLFFYVLLHSLESCSLNRVCDRTCFALLSPGVASSLLSKEAFALLIADSSELSLKQRGWL